MTPTPIPPRLSDEPAQWYARFARWLTMPMPRSVLGCYLLEWESKKKKKRGGPKKPEKKPANTPGSWEGKPVLYKWEERARAWDAAEVERLNAELAQARDDWRKAEMEAAQKLHERGMEGLKIALGAETSETEIKAVRVATQCLSEASELGRRALEMPTARTVSQFDKMSDAEILRFIATSLGNGAGPTEAGDDDAQPQ